jgi:hypothetical protein
MICVFLKTPLWHGVPIVRVYERGKGLHCEKQGPLTSLLKFLLNYFILRRMRSAYEFHNIPKHNPHSVTTKHSPPKEKYLKMLRTCSY